MAPTVKYEETVKDLTGRRATGVSCRGRRSCRERT